MLDQPGVVTGQSEKAGFEPAMLDENMIGILKYYEGFTNDTFTVLITDIQGPVFRRGCNINYINDLTQY